MKYRRDSTAEKLEKDMPAKREVTLRCTHVQSAARGHVAGGEIATWSARVRCERRECDAVREGATWNARVRRGAREHTYVR